MLNKLTSTHPLSRYKADRSENKKKTCLMHFDPDARGSLSLANDTRYNVVKNFLQ